ncbi:MAG: hypothetical protein WCG29_02935 [Desulfomonile sp.]|jgi:hypothetical protein
MRKNPFIVLVCLLFIAIHCSVGCAGPRGFIKITIDDNTVRTNTSGAISLQQPANIPLSFKQASAPGFPGQPRPMASAFQKPIVKCKTPEHEVGPACVVDTGPPCILPHRNCGQWELSVQAFFARIGGKVSWPYHPVIDFNDDLGLDCHKTVFEYSARYQFRPRWSIIYSIMPIELEAHYRPPMFPGFMFTSKWQSVYQRLGLMYEPIRTCSGAISVYSSWVLNDTKLCMDNGSLCGPNTAISIQRTRNMVMSGIEFQKCIRTMCNGGSLSCDNRAGVAYLDGAPGIDVQTGLQYSVPLNCGRYGYAKGGYRLINFWEDRNDRKIETFLNGWFAEMGLVF